MHADQGGEFLDVLATPVPGREGRRAVPVLGCAGSKGRRPEIDHGKRIAELQREIEHLLDAVAAGQLRGSPALAKRLTAAEAELERLQVRQSIQPLAIIVPDVRKRVLAMVDRLDEVLTAEPERGRAALQEVLGERIT